MVIDGRALVPSGTVEDHPDLVRFLLVEDWVVREIPGPPWH